MASLSNRRSMFIDDNLGEVEYSGTWFLDTYDRPGPFQFVGMTAKQTAHGTNTTGGFSFSFEGTSFAIEGQSSVIPSTTNSALTCTVDGVDGTSDVVTAANLRSWGLCKATGLSAGRHEVIVNITAGPNTVFWLDEIYYWSLPNPNLRRKYSMFLASEGDFRYSGVSWFSPFDEQGILGRETYATGGKVTIPFYGDSVEFTAYLTSQMPRAAGSGSYSIDGGEPTTFEIPAWTPGFRGMPSNETIFRVPLFTTPKVPAGHHNLEVINRGNANTSPLSIDYIYVSHGDVDAVTATAQPNLPAAGVQSTGTKSNPSSSTGPPLTTTESATPQKTPPWPIVGGVVGGVVVLALIAFILYLWRKRSKKLEPQVRLSPEDAWNLNMQAQYMPVTTVAPYDIGPTPPAYSETSHPYEHSQIGTPLGMTMNNTTGAPVLAIPPQKQRFITPVTPYTRDVGPSASTPTHSLPGSLASRSQHGALSDHSQSTNPSLQAVPGSVMPRRVPPRLPPKKG